jgi:NhaP-type Na+/H+ or K+/H+ antiporter
MAGARVSGRVEPSVRRLMLVVALAAAGLAVSAVARGAFDVHLRHLAGSFVYGKCVTTLLTVGLFAAAYGISRRELRRNARIVLVAITLGVALKAALVGAIMALVYGSAGFILLGVAVAQIDPLSVAATLRRSGMSGRAKSILLAWASFDDPVTVLLVYLGSFALPLAQHHARAGLGLSASSFLAQIFLNAALIAVAGVAWYLLRVLGESYANDRLSYALQCLVLVGLLAAAAWYGLLIGITVCGLFFRPAVGAIVDRAVNFAFYAAVILLGLLLVDGVNIPAGILLGVAVFAMQVVTALAITRGLPRADRFHLAVGQQNGLTAIVLGLALQPYLPQAVGIIAVAILTVNVIHICTNRSWQLKSPVLAAVDSKMGTSACSAMRSGSTVGASAGEAGERSDINRATVLYG